jgi:hypothetical protein
MNKYDFVETKRATVLHEANPQFGIDLLFNQDLRSLVKKKFKNDEYVFAAYVESDNLEKVFELTNHIHADWTKNEGVQAQSPQRSTSVGDLVRLPDGKWYYCDMAGWVEVLS